MHFIQALDDSERIDFDSQKDLFRVVGAAREEPGKRGMSDGHDSATDEGGQSIGMWGVAKDRAMECVITECLVGLSALRYDELNNVLLKTLKSTIVMFEFYMK